MKSYALTKCCGRIARSMQSGPKRFRRAMWAAIVVPALAAIVVAGGCSSSSGGNGGAVTFACASYEPTGDGACKACIQSSSSCAADAVTAFGMDWETNLAGGLCKDATTCLAGCSCGDNACVQSCLQGGGMACLEAEHALYTCLSESCSSPCGAVPPSNDAGSDAGSSGMDSGLVESGGAIDSGGGNDVQVGTPPDASTARVACNQSAVDHYCIIHTVPVSTVASTQSMCSQQGGTVDTTCPTANLVGCCSSGSVEECYYPPTYNTSNGMGGCTLAGGVWSMTE